MEPVLARREKFPFQKYIMKMDTIDNKKQKMPPMVDYSFYGYLPPLSVIYFLMGPLRYTSGEPLSMRSSEASVLVANSENIVSIQRALILSQSIKPRA